MKQKLLNKLWLRVGMIVAIMTTALSGTAWADTSTLTFAAKCNGSGTADDGVEWTVTSDGTESNFDNDRGIHYGTNSAAVQYITLTTSQIPGTITKIVVNASGNNNPTLSVKVGGNNFGTAATNLTTSNAAYTFNGSASGTIVVDLRKSSSAKKALFVKSVEVTYTTGSVTPTCATPTFSPAAGAYTSAQNVTISTTTTGATIYYTTDGSEPTTNSSVYSSAIPVSNTKTIKAMAVAAGYDNSSVATATYTIVSIEHEGTQADPYTVADARNAIDAGVGCTGVYVAGKVSHINGYYSSKYITYWISDDGTSQDLEAYNGLGLNGAEFSSKDDLQEGDVVVIYGDLTKYNSTYEFSSGNYLVSHTSSSTQVAAGLSYSATTATADLADLTSFTAPTLSNPHSLPISYESSNTDVATVASDGTVTPLAKGTTTITATSEETSEYLAGEASYTLTVTNSNAALVTVDADGNTTFDFTDNAWGFPISKQVDEESFTNSGYTVTVAGSTGNGFYFDSSAKNLLVGKSGAYLSLPAFTYNVNKIVVEGDPNGSGSVTQNIFAGDDPVSTATTSAKITQTYDIDEAYQEAGTIYKLIVTNANNTRVSKIIVYKAPIDERTPVTLTFTGVPSTIVMNETATYAVTATPSVTGITYSSSDDNIVMVDPSTGEIGALALGTATITATFTGDANYKPATASYKIEVIAPQHTAKFFVNGVEQTTAEVQVSEGDAITFPTAPATLGSKTFVGWTTAAIATEQTTAPETLVYSATMGDADVNYYAVYATVTGGGSTTATLTEAEIMSNFSNAAMAYNDNAKTFADTGDNITWEVKGYATKDAPWIQLRKNATVAYMKISAPSDITNLQFTISNTTVGSGASTSVLTNHGAFAGSLILLDQATANATEGTLGSSNTVSDYILNVVPTSSVEELYVQVTAAARIWGVEVTYGSASYSGYCTTVAPATESVTVTNAGYATYCSENALDFTGTDITAYVGTIEGTHLTFTPITQVPATTGLLLKAEGGATVNVPVIASAPELTITNCLVGVNVETNISSNDYILNKVNDGVGFYKAGQYTVLGAHKAYIPAAVGNGVKGFTIDFDDDATGISLMEDGRSQMEDGVIYNLAGQRINKMQKGINIVNGKKILK